MDIGDIKNHVLIKRTKGLTDVEQKIIDIEIKRLEMVADFRRIYFSRQIWIHIAMFVVIISTYFSFVNFLSNLGFVNRTFVISFILLSITVLIAMTLLLVSYLWILRKIEKDVSSYHDNYSNIINKIQKDKILGIQKWGSELGNYWKVRYIIYVLLMIIPILILIQFIVIRYIPN